LAVFGEVSYRPIERIELTAGLRYTADEKQLTVRQYGAFGLPLFAGAFFPAFGPVSAEAEFDRLTPRFIANFKLTDDVSLYASYSQGFQAGAFQGFQLSAANAVVPINETIVHSYEAGLRSQFFDRRLTVNITGFHADYKDLPTTQFTSASGFLEASTFDADGHTRCDRASSDPRADAERAEICLALFGPAQCRLYVEPARQHGIAPLQWQSDAAGPLLQLYAQ
jgi:iron complex outermembrane receptor protein